MLTIEIPEKIRQLVAIARLGEFPASCWATEIVSDWLWDITTHAGYTDPEVCPMVKAVDEELGIEYVSFLQAGGDLYRATATTALTRALGMEPDRDAFLQASAMRQAIAMCVPGVRSTIELEWRDIVPGFEELTFPQEHYMPLPVWQCLMRYFADDWRDPITSWHQATKEYFEAHIDELSYSHDQNVPFPATT